jgi:hypothetical protein
MAPYTVVAWLCAGCCVAILSTLVATILFGSFPKNENGLSRFLNATKTITAGAPTFNGDTLSLELSVSSKTSSATH